MDEVPVFAPAGAIVTLAPKVMYTDALPGGPLQVQVYGGADGHFTMVEDDGESTAYTDGKTRATSFSWIDGSRTLSWTVSDGVSSPSMFTEVFVTLFDRTSGTHHSSTTTLGQSGSIVVS